MCGFIGIAGIQPKNVKIDLKRASELLISRGPDDFTQYKSNDFALCFRRLAIVGGTNGRQPFIGTGNRLVVAVNGEIYNHQQLRTQELRGVRFSTYSDCEVVLHLYKKYGLSLVDKVRGMYSIVLYDAVKCMVYLIRDRFGIKPMYYAHKRDALYFSTEIKPLMRIPALAVRFAPEQAILNPWLAGYPSYNPHGLQSFFQDVEYLAGGTLLAFDLSTLQTHIQKYWQVYDRYITHREHGVSQSSLDCMYSYKAALKAAVKEECPPRLPIGLFLSGGIDAGVLASLASRESHITAFTIQAASLEQNGELAHARKVAAQFDIPLYEVSVDRGLKDFGISQWIDLVHTCESPFTSPEQIYKLSIYAFSKRALPQLKVFVSGQGSDELNGGYTTQYTQGTEDGWMLFLMALNQLEENTRTYDVQKLVAWWNKDCQAYPLIDRSIAHNYQHLCGKYNLHKLPWINFVKNKVLDLQTYNLWHEDRLAAAVGAENRVPFLNNLVTDAVFSVPQHGWESMFFNKQILRSAFRNEIGRELSERPKVPLYYGAGEVHTATMMLQLVKSNNYALLDYAFPSRDACPWIHKDHLIAYTKNAYENRSKAHWEKVVRLVNIGILSRMHHVFG
jgi:asparagine synthase (glutamine-hydrolysing)